MSDRDEELQAEIEIIESNEKNLEITKGYSELLKKLVDKLKEKRLTIIYAEQNKELLKERREAKQEILEELEEMIILDCNEEMGKTEENIGDEFMCNPDIYCHKCKKQIDRIKELKEKLWKQKKY